MKETLRFFLIYFVCLYYIKLMSYYLLTVFNIIVIKIYFGGVFVYSLESTNIALFISVVSLLLILALFIYRILDMLKKDEVNIRYVDDRLINYKDIKSMSESDKQIFYNLVLDEVYKCEDELKIEGDTVKEIEEISDRYLFDVVNHYYKEKYNIEDEDDIYYYCTSKDNASVNNFKIVKMNTYQLGLLFRRYKRFGLIDLEVFKTDEHIPRYYKLEDFELKLEDIH